MTHESRSPDSPRLLTVAEAAERMNVGERFIRRLMFEKRIPYRKLGEGRAGKVRIDEADLDAFIDASRVEAVSS